MTVFEYLMVMTSIVLAVTLTQLLRGLTEIWRSPTRQAPHLAWVIVLSFMTVQHWWAFWDLNQVTDWNAIRFGFVLATPILLFLASAVLLPQRIADDADLRDYFVTRRRDFMVIMTILAVVAIVMSRVLLGLPFTHPYRIWQLALGSFLLSGVLVTSERYHRWLPWLFFTTLLVSQVLFRSRPGAFAVT
jgi:hypothetical protein